MKRLSDLDEPLIEHSLLLAFFLVRAFKLVELGSESILEPLDFNEDTALHLKY